jgi:hypothetical protein
MSNKLTHLEEYSTPKGIVALDEVSKILFEQMLEVKKNPAAIPQAECVSELAGRMVEIAVAQVKQANMVIDMIRVKNDQGA